MYSLYIYTHIYNACAAAEDYHAVMLLLSPSPPPPPPPFAKLGVFYALTHFGVEKHGGEKKPENADVVVFDRPSAENTYSNY